MLLTLSLVGEDRRTAPGVPCDKRKICFPFCTDTLIVTKEDVKKIVWIYVQLTLNMVKWRHYCCWYSHFLFEKMSDVLASGKKDPSKHLCSQLYKNSQIQWTAVSIPSDRQNPCRKTPRFSVYATVGTLWSVLLIGHAAHIQLSSHPVGTDAGFSHRSYSLQQQRLWRPSHYARQRFQIKTLIPQVRTNLFHSFGVYPFFRPAPNAFLEIHSKRAKSSAKRCKRRSNSSGIIFHPLEIFSCIQHTDAQTQILKPYWKHGLKSRR